MLLFPFAGVLGEQVKVTKDKTRVTVTSEADMSKRCAPVLCVMPAGGGSIGLLVADRGEPA